MIDARNLPDLSQALIEWARDASRAFPWRETSNPYAILIAEKLLQQTAARVVVVRVFEALLKEYPTPTDLVTADPNQLDKLLLPLGLLYRARELPVLAQVLVRDFDGQVPRDESLLLSLPGVGPYIARAVLSFAFRQDIAVVDTNVARFLYRTLGIEGPLPKNPARKTSLLKIADVMVPAGQSKEYNLAVLDLCAQICLARRPRCSSCPVRTYCHYGSDAHSRGIKSGLYTGVESESVPQ